MPFRGVKRKKGFLRFMDEASISVRSEQHPLFPPSQTKAINKQYDV
jgi:hypothetical protein